MKLMTMKLMLTCKNATEMIDKIGYFEIPKVDKFKLNLHLLLCKNCKNYFIQNEIIEKYLIEKYFSLVVSNYKYSVEESKTFKIKLKNKIKNLE